jgi:hypothetical protein
LFHPATFGAPRTAAIALVTVTAWLDADATESQLSMTDDGARRQRIRWLTEAQRVQVVR